MKKTDRITLRLTPNQKEILESEAERMGVSMGWILRENYFGEKCPTLSDNIKIKKSTTKFNELHPPPPIVRIKKPIEVLPPDVEPPRGKIQKSKFLNEIRDVFKEKGIFVN